MVVKFKGTEKTMKDLEKMKQRFPKCSHYRVTTSRYDDCVQMLLDGESKRRIMKELRMGRMTLQRIIGELQEKGMLKS